MRGARRLAGALALAVLLAAAPRPAAAVSCHCFQDREYDAARPAASDPYLLATASNTLLAAAHGVPKGEIVRALMEGTPGGDLWVAHHAAGRQRRSVASELAARAKADSWAAAFKAQGGPLAPLGMRMMAAVGRGGGDAELARIATAETLAERLGTPRAELDALLARGAPLQELVLASLLGRWLKRPAPELLDEAGRGTAWSALLARAGLAPKEMETAVPKAIGAAR